MRLLCLVGVAVVILLLVPEPAAACATCFGAPDSALTKGMNGAIMTLLGVIGVVQIGFVAMFASFVRRAKRLRERREGFRLIRGGAR